MMAHNHLLKVPTEGICGCCLHCLWPARDLPGVPDPDNLSKAIKFACTPDPSLNCLKLTRAKSRRGAALLGCYGSTQGLSAMGQISLHTAATPAQFDSEEALKYR